MTGVTGVTVVIVTGVATLFKVVLLLIKAGECDREGVGEPFKHPPTRVSPENGQIM